MPRLTCAAARNYGIIRGVRADAGLYGEVDLCIAADARILCPPSSPELDVRRRGEALRPCLANAHESRGVAGAYKGAAAAYATAY